MSQDTIEKTREVLKRRSSQEWNEPAYGKVPPQARELEEAVLGACMIESDAVHKVVPMLPEEAFYVDAHQKIWNAIRMLHSAQREVDMLTVTEQLRANNDLEGVGGPFYISHLTNKVGSAAHIEHHATIVLEKYVARQIINHSSSCIKEAYEDSADVFDLLEKLQTGSLAIGSNFYTRNERSIGALADEAVKKVAQMEADPGQHLGIPTGFANLDLLVELEPGTLTIIGARPSMGKTAFSLALARNMAALGHGVAFFSLEMTAAKLTYRLLSMASGVDANKIRKARMSDAEKLRLSEGLGNLQSLNLLIDDSSHISPMQLLGKARRIIHDHGVKAIMIDYLGLMNPGSTPRKIDNKTDEIGFITGQLKAISKQLQVPVILLCQLSRANVNRGGDKRPMLSDLRSSGDIEQDADVVLFVHRPEYYGTGGSEMQGMAEIIIAKNRDGVANDSVWFTFNGAQTKFTPANPPQQIND